MTDLDRQIAAELDKTHRLHHANESSAAKVDAPALAMPDDAEHLDGATEIGRLSAQGVAREYEVAAEEIAAMGVELLEHVKQCETMTRDAFAVTEELKEIAARYREQGKRICVEIERSSELTSEIRKACTELRDKIASRQKG